MNAKVWLATLAAVGAVHPTEEREGESNPRGVLPGPSRVPLESGAETPGQPRETLDYLCNHATL